MQIDLKPGWKTYWLDPGDAGVPPTLDVSASSNVASAELSFPAPQRFDDGFAKWAGYDGPVSFPVAFALADPKQPATIEAKVFLGICETICVPVQATLTLDPAERPRTMPTMRPPCKAALDALPGPEQPDFGVTLLKGGKDEVLVEAAFAGEPGVGRFLPGRAKRLSVRPARAAHGRRAAAVLGADPRTARQDARRGALHYTLVTGAGAVSGTLPYPAQ